MSKPSVFLPQNISMEEKARLLLQAIVLIVLLFETSLASAVTPSEVIEGKKVSETSSAQLHKATEKPVKPFDWVNTNSPRATFESFLVGTQRYYDLIRNDGYTASNRRELTNIIEQAERLFDLREIPSGQSRNVAHETTALIREALARVPLPALDEVPDEDEMANRLQLGKSLVYRVPGTPFEIARTEDGPDTGRYQFTQETVAHAPDFYEEIKIYPYDPAQTAIKGLYEAYQSHRVREKAIKPFDWVNTNSPRATFESFLVGTRRYYDLIRNDGYTASNWRELTNISEQAERLFNLGEVPPGQSHNVAHETTALIREALARVPLPELDEVPDEDEMANRLQLGKSLVYRVPGTPFEIARTEDGPDTGRYQFTQETVAHAPDFYEEIKVYPYHPAQTAIKGLYEAYFLSPGPLIPRSWVDSLPMWMQYVFLANRIWQWLLLAVTVAVFLTTILVLHIVIFRMSRGWSPLNRNLVLLLRPLATMILTYSSVWFLTRQVHLTGGIGRVVEFGEHLILLLASVVITMGLGNVLAETIVNVRRFQNQRLDQQLIRLLVRLLSVIIAVVIVIEEMQQLGFSIATLLAGASVGGLAVALAAQDTLKNIFGGIELSLDKPFIVGQRVLIKGYDGEIEEIGLRSTKIRTLTGHQVTIPNEEVSTLDIENIGRRPYIRRDFNLTITYDTPVEKILRAVSIVHEILSVSKTQDKGHTEFDTVDSEREQHPNTAVNYPGFPPRVYFDALNSDSLNIRVIYWYHPPDYWKYLEHSQWINKQIIERFGAEDISFAFPTQTLYLAEDEKHPLAVPPSLANTKDLSTPDETTARSTTTDYQGSASRQKRDADYRYQSDS